MKTLLTGFLLMSAAIAAIVLLYLTYHWVTTRVGRLSVHRNELMSAMRNSTPIELRLQYTPRRTSFELQVRKKKWRLNPAGGWKYVNIYRGGDPILGPVRTVADPRDLANWIHVQYYAGSYNQGREQELLQGLIHTYGDLDGYYDLRIAQYEKDLKSWKTKETDKPEEK